MHQELKKLIKELGLSNEEFGNKLSPPVTRQTIDNWINKKRVPSLLAHRDQMFVLSKFKITQNSWDEKEVSMGS